MKILHSLVLALVAAVSLLVSPTAQAAAGRVLIAAGDVVAVRDGRTIALTDGSTVEAGDTINVGDRSSVQLLMIDKAVLALRANSSLALTAYRFDEKGPDSQSFFNLLRGGLRAVTGFIGKRNHDHFKLTTPTSTIGIRGTHFTVVQCTGNCLNADGSKAADGLFGGVSDGRIVVTNAAGDKEFRRNEYFYVASRDTAIKTLPEPPSFLRDPQDARGRAKTGAASGDKTVAKDSAAKQEEASQAAATAPATTTVPSGTAVNASAAANVAVANTIATTGATAVNNQPVILGVAYDVAESFVTTVPNGQQNTGFGIPPHVDTTRSVPILEYRLTAQDWTTTDSTPISNADGSTTPQTTVTHLVKTASVGVGSSASAGNVTWGQYQLKQDFTQTVGTSAPTSSSNSRTRHWAIGDGVEQLPSSGSYTYTWVGGTTPTDLVQPAPRSGSLTSGGAIGVRFDDQTMSTLSPIQWSMPSSGSSYSVSFQNAVWTPTVTTQTDPTDGSTNRNLTYPTFNAPGSTCGNCNNLNVQVSPTFFGKTGQGLGLAITTQATVGSTVERTASTQVYKRP